MNLINLKPCVKCKSDKVKILYLENARYRVECSKCGQYIEFNAQSYLGACVMWNETFRNDYSDRWIPVSEKMPGFDLNCLVTTKSEEIATSKFYGYGEEFQGFREYPEGVWEINACEEDVIAWKPLPLPYKED